MAFSHASHGSEIAIVEPFGDLASGGEALQCIYGLFVDTGDGFRDQQVAALQAVNTAAFHQLVGPGQPSAAPRQLARLQQPERQPERAASGPGRLAYP